MLLVADVNFFRALSSLVETPLTVPPEVGARDTDVVKFPLPSML